MTHLLGRVVSTASNRNLVHIHHVGPNTYCWMALMCIREQLNHFCIKNVPKNLTSLEFAAFSLTHQLGQRDIACSLKIWLLFLVSVAKELWIHHQRPFRCEHQQLRIMLHDNKIYLTSRMPSDFVKYSISVTA